MVRANGLKHVEYREYCMRSFMYQLRSALLCPNTMRKRDR